MRGKVSELLVPLYCALGRGLLPEGGLPHSVASGGQAPARRRSRVARHESEGAESGGGRNLRSSPHAFSGCGPPSLRSSAEASSRLGCWSRGPARTPSARDELRLVRGRSLDTDALRGGASGRAGLAASKSPFPCDRPRSAAPSGGLSRLRLPPPRRSSVAGAFRSRAASYPVPTEVGPRLRDTQRGNSTTPPLGFGPLRRIRLGDRCADLPPRHRPLPGFLTLSAV
jgi:hypothetical protein